MIIRLLRDTLFYHLDLLNSPSVHIDPSPAPLIISLNIEKDSARLD